MTLIPELYWLTITALFTSLLWVPYILKTITEIGIFTALTERSGASPSADWAVRLKKAHANAVENLVVFAPLVIVLAMTETNTELTATAALVFFAARAAHAVIYTLGLPFLRTISFFAGFLCQAIIGLTILGLI